jgi:signal transduction histidine kinase
MKDSLFMKIQNSITRTTSLLDEILLLNHDNDKLVKFRPIQLNFYKLCNTVLDELKLFARNDVKITFQNNLTNNLIKGDENILRYILRNLLSNAIKYSKPNGIVLFNIKNNSYNDLIIIIEDNGIGISEEDLQHLYEPFYRGQNTENIPGTGIGLSIVKKFTDAHNGKIQITSKLNIGTTINVIIPVEFINK